MKIQLLVSTGILLVALLPCHECRALSKSVPASADSALQQPDLLQEQPQSLPILLRVGEEYFLRLGNVHKNPAPAASSFSSISSGSRQLAASASAGNFFRAAVQQLQNPPERSLEGAADPWESEDDGAHLEATEKEKRSSKDSPISIDLTFHLLRQLLEMARAEQLAQQVESNRKMLETIGK
ncbi:corticoliberin [Rhineura floridana]|uniref:corticoliberin n=1 Tax=Rhineura floridana TaxID=261503 RepID=UPI002AC82915|nr:corticoliberin [Rhineura floridana]XP_061459171.1 corticoliberin [Rhineura floridana]